MTFGRKGGDYLAGVPDGLSIRPASPASAVSDPGPALDDEIADGDSATWANWLGYGAIALISVLALENLFAGTSLITPINHGFLNTMRALGAASGVAVWMLSRNMLYYCGMSGYRKVMSAIGLPLFALVMFDAFAWRIGDNLAFAFSNAQWEKASYPITGTHRGRRGSRDAVQIDPFATGEPADIPVPRDQLVDLGYSYQGRCITVVQRRSPAGAIEIRTDGVFNLAQPAFADIEDCPAS